MIVPVTVYIPGPLREFSEGQSKVEIEESPATVAGVLSALWILFPGLRDRIATEQGEIREHINIFVGDEDVRFSGGLSTRISDGAEISIVPSITGGGFASKVGNTTNRNWWFPSYPAYKD